MNEFKLQNGYISDEEMERIIFSAGDWSVPDDDYSKFFLAKNQNQFWMPEEVAVSTDLPTWRRLSDEERDVYIKVLAGLTLLDTLQGNIGMPQVSETVQSHQKKAVFSFMGAMENSVHARSYSHIYLTLASQEKIRETFEWIKDSNHLQRKARIFVQNYMNNVDDPHMTRAASIFLESFSFYSGFFYPLFLAGQGKVRASGDIISLIVRDESIHGIYTGLVYQEDVAKISKEEQADLRDRVYALADELLEGEMEYTRSLYDSIGLTHEVIDYIKYNANKALNNLGYPSRYEHDRVNPIVLNGLKTDSTAIDYFSEKGKMYKKAEVETIQDEDFYFED